ncbi:hypothetical protein [Clostridium magnum]|uniref:Uncharacterized protein n=1 Tax=Clostridium magnum DSM 2767 TaxID=1121326 RepID=A0A161WR34_9CLOT|nr:hypothetical protein [Clostridium magnum]KZL89168.1 hypothetical protein CLMAG_53860 [Clostridium magnum DSM 2767]SHJ24981.1 hypothetical protein SAMN02745944_05608 [Clostridium magnum DSM 2767]
MTTSEECSHCKTPNMFRGYELKRGVETDRFTIAIYDCKCSKCNKEFEILDIYDMFED